MKRILMLATVISLLALGAGTALAQSGYDLFQKALVKERAVGDVEEALRLYQRIVREFGSNRPLAAKAQLRMGLLYDRLGRKAEAQRAFETIVNQYGDQTEVARSAQAKIIPAVGNAARGNAKAGANKNAADTLTVRRVWADHTGASNGTVFGAPSPDGRYLSYVDWDTGCLAVRDFATGEKRRPLKNKKCDFTEGFLLYSTFSPDNKWIAYNWLDFKNLLWELHVIGIDSSNPRLLYRNEEVDNVYPTGWSPDGKQILAVLTRKDRTNQIVFVSAADAAVRVLKTLDWRLPQPSLSPDGRYIAYDLSQQQGSQDRDIFLLSADGSREVPLVSHLGNDFVLGWTPDGTRILFASDRRGTIDAWAIRVINGKAQGEPEMVKRNLGQIDPMGFTRKGSYYYGVRTGIRDVYTATLDIATGKLLSPPAPAAQRFLGTNVFPEWSPDGQYLAYNSNRQPFPDRPRSRVLCIRSLKTGDVRELSPKLNYFGSMRWFPDGRALLVQGSDEKNRSGFFRVDAQTGEVSTVFHHENAQQPVFSADGRSLFLVTFTEDKVARIVEHELETGQRKELYRGFARYLTLSPDGRRLAFETREGGSRLRVISVAGGPPHELYKAQANDLIYAVAWTPDRRYLLFGMHPNAATGKTELWRIPVEGGEPQKLELSMDELESLRIHPDGRRIAFVAGQPKGEVWVMENFLPAAQTKRRSVSRR